jgi:hypothetical protein
MAKLVSGNACTTFEDVKPAVGCVARDSNPKSLRGSGCPRTGVARAGSPWLVHPSQALRPGRRLRGPIRAAATRASARARAAPGRRPPGQRVQQTVLDECWKPAFARYLIPKQTGLRLDLERYLRYYNTERAHTGRWIRGRTPEAVLGKAKLWHKQR